MPGRDALNFRPATSAPVYNTLTKNLLIAWDLFKQDYRMVNCDNVVIVSQIAEGVEFWRYFNQELRDMSAEQKSTFFNI